MPDPDRLIAFLHPAQYVAFKAAGMIEKDSEGEFIQCAMNGRIVVKVYGSIPTCKSK
jgi:hypothetical protein